MGLLSIIWNGIKSFFQFCREIVSRVINGILNFVREVVNYFIGLRLNPNTQSPFVMRKEEVREMIKNAPVKDMGIFTKKETIVEGVYNEETDEIEHVRVLGADRVDEQTKEILGNEPLVVLT